MTDLTRRLAVARGDEPADLVVRGGRVLSVYTREWLEADVAVCDGWIAGVGEYRRPRDAGRRRAIRRPRPDRCAPAPRVVAAARGRVRQAGAAVRHHVGGRRPPRDRKRARHRRRALAGRRLRRSAAGRVLHGPVVRARVAVRVAAAGAHHGRPGGPAAAPERAGPGRDDELPGRDRRRSGRAREAGPGGSGARRRPRPRRARPPAAGLRRRRDRIGPRGDDATGGTRAAAGGHVAADPRGIGRPEPRRAAAAGARVRPRADRILHRRPRARAHRPRGPRQLDGAPGGGDGGGCPRRAGDGLLQRGRLARTGRPRRDRAGAASRPADPARPRAVPAGRGAQARPGAGAAGRATRAGVGAAHRADPADLAQRPAHAGTSAARSA